MIALVIVLTCNFELSDLPYFRGITRNAWEFITALFNWQKTDSGVAASVNAGV